MKDVEARPPMNCPVCGNIYRSSNCYHGAKDYIVIIDGAMEKLNSIILNTGATIATSELMEILKGKIRTPVPAHTVKAIQGAINAFEKGGIDGSIKYIKGLKK